MELGHVELSSEGEEKHFLHEVQRAAVAEQGSSDQDMQQEEWRREQYTFVERRKTLEVAEASAAVKELKHNLFVVSQQLQEAWKRCTQGQSEQALAQDQLARLQHHTDCLLYTSPSPRDRQKSRMPSSA